MAGKSLEVSGSEEAQELVKRLAALKAEWPSEPSLRALSPQVVDALIQHFTEIEVETMPNLIGGACSLCAMLLMAVLVLGVTIKVPWLSLITGLSPLMLIALLSGYAMWRLVVHGWQGQWNCTVYALTQTEDVRVLETLIFATQYQWGRHPEVIRAIHRLLDHVTQAHVGLLSDRAQQRLWNLGIAGQALSEGYEYDAAGKIRVLRALAAVGNQATYLRLKRFAARSEHFVGERYVIATARDLLPLMASRLQRGQVPATLLRASDAPDTTSDTLLRATPASTPEPATQLLRASPSGHTGTEA